MRQQLRLRVLVPVAVLGLLGAGFGAFAMGGPAAPQSIPVPRATSSAAVDTGATDTGATDTGATDTAPPTTTAPAPAPPPTTTEAAPPAEPAEELSALDKKLAQNKVVVVVFHTPGSDVDAAAVREARAGASSAGAGYLAVDVTKNGAVTELAVEYEVSEAPTVLVVVKSGEAVSRFDGIVDRKTVAQAVTNALR
jgi:hypothetical protein